MTQENIEIVRRAFEASARRDSTAVLAPYDPDVEWDASRSQEGLADTVYRGRDGLRQSSASSEKLGTATHTKLLDEAVERV